MKKQYIQPATSLVLATPASCLMVSRSYEVGDKTNQGLDGNVQDGNDYSGPQRAKGNAWTTWEED